MESADGSDSEWTHEDQCDGPTVEMQKDGYKKKQRPVSLPSSRDELRDEHGVHSAFVCQHHALS